MPVNYYGDVSYNVTKPMKYNYRSQENIDKRKREKEMREAKNKEEVKWLPEVYTCENGREVVIPKTKEESDADFKKEKARANRERAAKTMAKNATAKHYTHKNTSGQLEMLMTQILKQFVDELRGKPLLEIDWTNKESVARRKDHLTVINSTMTMIRSLRDLKGAIAEDESGAKVADVVTPENVILMDNAKEMLSKVGLKAVM